MFLFLQKGDFPFFISSLWLCTSVVQLRFWAYRFPTYLTPLLVSFFKLPEPKWGKKAFLRIRREKLLLGE